MQNPEDFLHWRIICSVRSRFGALTQCEALDGRARGDRRTPQFLLNLVLIVIFSIPLLSTQAQGSPRHPDGGSCDFNIPSQSVEKALDTLAKQTGLLLLFPYDQVQSIETQSLIGCYSIDKAISFMLQDTGLSGDLTDGGVIVISRNGLNGKGKNMYINTKKSLLATFIAVFGAGAVSSGVMAQEGDKEGMGWLLEEITVTAQKREQSLQDIPLSVQVLTDTYLENNNITKFEDMQFSIPGLLITENTPTANDVSMRGLPNAPGSLGLEPMVDMYWNGIPVTSEMILGSMFDMERVEVLRGPQGALQGRPAPGGVIQMHSKKPDVSAENDMEGRLRSTVSDDGDFEIEGGISISLIPDRLAIRFAGLTNSDDGAADYVNASGQKTSRDNEVGRLSVAWEPLDTFRASLVSQINRRKTSGSVGTVAGFGSQGYHGPYKDPRSFFEFDRFRREHVQHNLTMEWDLSGHKVTSQTGIGTNEYSWDFDTDRQSASDVLRPIFVDDSQKRLVQELRFESLDTGFWEYMFGAYYLNANHDRVTELEFLSSTRLFKDEQTQLGFFTFHRLNLSDQLSVQGGFRWQSYENWSLSTDKLTKDSAPTGSAQISYDFNDDSMVYVSFQRSYRPGGGSVANEAIVDAALGINAESYSYSEETSNDVELGLKTTLFDGRLQVNLNLYRQEFDGLIGGTELVPIDANLDAIFTRFVNGDDNTRFPTNTDVVSQGLELELQALLTNNWNVSGAISRNEVENIGGSAIPCTAFGGSGEIVYPVGKHFSTCDIDGPVDQVPEWSLAITSEYIYREISPWADGYLRGRYNSRGSRPTRLNESIDDLESFSTLAIYTGLRSIDGKWDISLWAENLTNEASFTHIANSVNFQNAYDYVNFIPERRYGIAFNYKFSL